MKYGLFLVWIILFCRISQCESICREIKKYMDSNSTSIPWSHDFIVKTIINIQKREFCTKEEVDFLKSIYLHRLSISVNNKEETDFLFRAFIMPEYEALKIKKIIFKQNKSGKDIASAVFGKVSEINGVVVINPSNLSPKNLIDTLSFLCTGNECPFWNNKVLYKLIIIDKDIASFIPETATLVLSKDIVSDEKIDNKIIIAHELCHIAIEYNKLKQIDWLKTFNKFSGWHLKKKMKVVKFKDKRFSRTDLNNAILRVEIDGKKFDGFVFEKSYINSLKRNDTSEDLADHVAAFIYAPQRFCFGSIPIAPEKYKWISHEIFGKKETLSCPFKEK